MAKIRYRIRSLVDSLRVPPGYWEKYEESSNGWAVFASIVAAVLIWFMISMRESYSVVRDFQVEFVNLAPDTAFAERPLSSVLVRVEGAGWQLLKLYTTSTPIQVDANERDVDLFAAAARSLAPDLIPRSVTPAQISLALEQRSSRKVPIELRAQVEVVPPFDLVRQIRLDPDSVEVSGAISVLAQLQSWPTQELEMDRINKSFASKVALSDTLADLVRRSIDDVSAFGEVSEFTENSRMLDVIVSDAPSGQGRFRLIPDQVSIRYRVPIGQFEASAVTDSFFAIVSYFDILSDTTGRVSPTVRIPSDIVVRDLRIDTPRLQYYVVLE
jgi:hypothetical protein